MKSIHFKDAGPLLRNPTARRLLRAAQERFVFTQMDKASGNFAVVCKWFYQFRLAEEIFKRDSAYSVTDELPKNIVERIVKELFDDFLIEVPELERKLALYYWTAKMHKSPLGARFIAAMHCCVTKELARIANLGMTTLLRFWKKHCNTLKRTTGINYYWIIKNTDHAKMLFSRANRFGNIKDITGLDFSTLYTSIPHGPLLTALEQFVRGGFELAYASEHPKIKGHIMAIGNKKTSWVKSRPKKKTKTVYFQAESFLALLTYQLANVFVQVGDTVLKQDVGIPMGVDNGPNLANVFLFIREYNWIAKKMKTKEGKKMLKAFFDFIGRYIDDLMGLNNNKMLLKYVSEIYPEELILKLENVENGEWTPHKATFLNMVVKLNNNRVLTAPYDKREAFEFFVNRFFCPLSNIDIKRAHSVIGNTLANTLVTSDMFTDFKIKIQKEVRRLGDKNASTKWLQSNVKKFFERRPEACLKYGKTVAELMTSIFDCVSS